MDVRWSGFLFLVCLTSRVCLAQIPEFYMKDGKVSVAEEDGKATVTVKRKQGSGVVVSAVAVKLEVVDNTATSADYNVANNRIEVQFAENQLESTVEITIIDDNEKESSETFEVSIISDTAYSTGTPAKTVVTITDNDTPIISLEKPSPTYESTGPLVLTATRTNGLSAELSVDLSIADDTAVAGKDYIKPDAAKFVFANGETKKTIKIELKNDMTEEKTESFSVSIVKNDKKFEVNEQKVTAEILDDDGPATFDCRRPGQNPCSNNALCNDKGICECNALDPPRVGYKCYYLKDDVDKSPCNNTSCPEHGTCVVEDGKSKCFCEAGYDDKENCLFPRYKVVCGKNDMAIQIDPIGSFQGKVYAYGYEDTCTFDDFANQKEMPNTFNGGKVKKIPNVDTKCGNATSVTTDNILRIYRLIYVQYNSKFKFAYDEFVSAECSIDMTRNITVESLSRVSASQADAVQVTSKDDIKPIKLVVTKDGAAVSSNTSVRMGEKLMIILYVNQSSEIGALLVLDVMIDNNQNSNPVEITTVKDGCFKDVAGIMSPVTSLMATPDNGVLKIELEFRPPKFKNSDDVRIKVNAKLCPKSDTKSCDLPKFCPKKRTKRSADRYGDTNVDYVLKVFDPDSGHILDNDHIPNSDHILDNDHISNNDHILDNDHVLDNDHILRNRHILDPEAFLVKHHLSESPVFCKNEILAVIGVMGVFLLLFVIVGIFLFCCLVRRKDKFRVDDFSSSITLPTKVNYS